MVERDLRLVEFTGARYHVAHVSTAAAIDAIRQAKADGLPVTCDTAPPYFALNETAIGDYRTFAKLSPPLRGEGDRRAVVEGSRDGTIDAIASDHAPWDQDSKRLPFSSASYGIVGLETLLPLSLELYHNRHLGLIEVLRHLTIDPARILGFEVGRLRPGAPADLVIFDPDAAWRIKTDEFRSKSKNAPFDGRPVQGRVERTIVDGRTIFERQEQARMTAIIAAAVIGYLLGSIPFGLVLTRLAGHGDIREIGSGNIGATNVLRTGSKALAALTLVFDVARAPPPR